MVEIVYEPDVRIIARTAIDDRAINGYLLDRGLWWTQDAPSTDADRLSEMAGRICYKSFNAAPGGRGQGRTRNDDYIGNIKQQQHFSVIEHAYFSFLIAGVSRSLTHELIRHRMSSVSQESQRYVDLSQQRFICPPDISPDSLEHQLFVESCHDSLESYNCLYDNLLISETAKYSTMSKTDLRKHCRQAARSVLPNAAETAIIFTCNCRELRHIIELRGGAGVEMEIRRLANKFLDLMKVEAPNIFNDFVQYEGSDSVPLIGRTEIPS